MKRVVIGLVGPIASGKGEVVKHLRQLGFVSFSLSDRVREEAAARSLPLTRENLQNVGDNLRETFGGYCLAERTLNLLSGDEEKIVIDSIRNPAEIEYLKKELGLTIIGIDASAENRLKWFLDRAVERGEDGTTAADFWKANNRDAGTGQIELGQQVAKCLAMSDIVIENNGSRKQLIDEIEYCLILEFGFSSEGYRKSKEK